MRKRLRVPALLLIMLAASIYISAARTHGSAEAQVGAPQLVIGDTPALAQFAWYLFVEAVRPSGNPSRPLMFETWQEQCDLQPALCSSAETVATRAQAETRMRRAHGSALAQRLGATGDGPKEGCNGMNTAGFPGVPASNVAPGAVFCEEVFVNAAEASYITTNKLTTIRAQQAYGAVTFPWQAVEIKVDWVPQSSFVKPFSCSDPTLYIETIQFEGQPAQCYAMVGMHISSKALPDWVWATFEPNNLGTNPNRCNSNLYSLCSDPWGTTSPTPYGPGKTPAQSAALGNLMKAANLPAAFSNYYLTGVQTQFVVNGQPTQLGNSFVEYNAGVLPHQASCITCHKYAYAGTTSVGGPPSGWPSIGYACNSSKTANCFPSAGQSWTSEDFSWLLGIMPTGGSPIPQPASSHPSRKR